jgi:3-methyladenine DNA glycosylase AlkD
MPKPRFLPIVNLLAQHFSILPQPSPAAFIKDEMAAMASPQRATVLRRFFKTGPGEYAEGDVFIGVRVPELRKLVKKHRTADMVVIEDLLRSPVHEHRQAALFLLIQCFRSAGVDGQAAIVDFYLSHTEYVNNWDLVDCSAHAIVGAFLLHRDKGILYRLVRSPRLWERRIAIVATWHFIRAGHVGDTLKLAARLLADTEDLIHKSVGWMLREVGKQDESALLAFLEAHYRRMPRTTLRYAIERFPQPRRRSFLKGNF